MLSVQNLTISFKSSGETNMVVHPISFALGTQQILGIVGESGSGKSVSSLAILGLLPKKQTKITGEILFEDKNLLDS